MRNLEDRTIEYGAAKRVTFKPCGCVYLVVEMNDAKPIITPLRYQASGTHQHEHYEQLNGGVERADITGSN